MHIVVMSGTNREGSLSLRLAEIIVADYRALDHEVDLIDLRDMGPDFLDPKAYKEPKPAVSAMVYRFLAADGVVFVVPEYNGGFPGILKLFIDMLPYPQGFDKRPCAFVGLAAGQFQALRAVEHLQGVTGYRHAYNFPRRVFIGGSFQQFDFETGKLKDPDLGKRLAEQAEGFIAFIGQVRGA